MGAMASHTYLYSYLRKACLTASALAGVGPLPALSGLTPAAERVALMIGNNGDAPAPVPANPGSTATTRPFAFATGAFLRLQPTGLPGDSGWFRHVRYDLAAG